LKNDWDAKYLAFFTNKIWGNKANEQSEFSTSDFRHRSEIARFANRKKTRLGFVCEDNSRQIQA
jgi:hypothetical protein